MAGHTHEGLLSPVPPWARLVPAPAAVLAGPALPRTSVSGHAGLPNKPLMLVTLAVVMPAVVMSAVVVVAVTPVYLLAPGGALVLLRGQAQDDRGSRDATSQAQ